MTSRVSDDDERLLDRLAEALTLAEPLAARIRQLGDGAYAWHGVDAELESAGVVYDSLIDADAGVRGGEDVPRTVMFEADTVSVELERTGDQVVGQIIPPRSGVIALVPAGGAATEAQVDDLGCFSFDRVPAGPVRLRWSTPAQAVVTDWIRL